MLIRSLRSLGRRAMVAGAASAVALTVFNAVQPSLGVRRIHPGTVRDVQLTLAPAPSPAAASASGAGAGRAGRAVVASPPVPVGKARFVGFSWPSASGAAAGGAAPTGGHAGLWLRTRGAAGWSGWQEVEVAGDGPDPGSPEHHPGRVFTEGVWLPAGTRELQ